MDETPAGDPAAPPGAAPPGGDAAAEAAAHAHLLAAAAPHPRLREALARLGPVRADPPASSSSLPSAPPSLPPSVADRLFVEVVNQQLSTRAAAAIWARIEAAALAAGATPRALFAAGDPAALRACGVSANKARALRAVAEAEAAGLLGPGLAALAHPERAAVLCGIRGVGPWTADMIGIFHFRDPDIWPDGDAAAAACLRRLTGCADTRAAARPFAPYRSHLARALWRIKDAPPAPAAGTAESG